MGRTGSDRVDEAECLLGVYFCSITTRRERERQVVSSYRTIIIMSNTERTYIMIKPDGVQRGLIGTIIQRFEQRGFILRGLKMLSVEKSHAEAHYSDLSSKPFFGGLVEYICSAPVCAMCWEGKDVVKTGRKIIGATNPLASEPGTIRGDFCIDVGRNIIHGSDAVESAQKELALWFPEGLNEYEHAMKAWIYE